MPRGEAVVGRSRRRRRSPGTSDGPAADAALGSRRDMPGIVNGALVPFRATQSSFYMYVAFWIKKSSWSAKPWSRIPQATRVI